MLDPHIPRLNVRLNGDGVVAHMQNAAKWVAQAISVLLPTVDRHDFSQNAEIGPAFSRYGFQAWADVEQDRAQFEAWLSLKTRLIDQRELQLKLGLHIEGDVDVGLIRRLVSGD